MSIGINYANTGLITQNQNVISSANQKLIGANETKLKAVTSGTIAKVVIDNVGNRVDFRV